MGGPKLKTPNPLHYPRWIVTQHGVRCVVNDHIQHSALTGLPFDENAQPVRAANPPEVVEEDNESPVIVPEVEEGDDPLGMFTTAHSKTRRKAKE
jgi:hypothetical protein